MNTYYISCQCKPLGGHANASLYSGMMADVCVVMPTVEDAKRLIAGYLQGEGWILDQLEHMEVMAEAPIHDSRLNSLFNSARKRGLAAALSPYR